MAGRAQRQVRPCLRHREPRADRDVGDRQSLRRAATSHRAPRHARPQRRPEGKAGSRPALGSDRVRRSPPDVSVLFRPGGQIHQASSAGRTGRSPHPPLSADDRDAAQRQGRGFPALHGPPRRRSFRRALPGRRPQGRSLGHDAPPDQGGALQIRRQPSVPRAPRLYRFLRPVIKRVRALRSGDPLCARGNEPRGLLGR